MIFAYQVCRGGEVQREAHMHVHPEIRGPLMTVRNYVGAANAYVIILDDCVCDGRGFPEHLALVFVVS